MIQEYGWDHYPFKNQYSDEAQIVKITAVFKHLLKGVCNEGEVYLELSGRFSYTLTSRSEHPAVGDWCRINPTYIDENDRLSALIEEVLPRKSVISRPAPGNPSEQQILVANVDQAFALTSANLDFSINRLQRYLYVIKQSDIEPSIVLSKIDLAKDIDPYLESLKAELSDIPIYPISSDNGDGLEMLLREIADNKTVVFLGSSGVGKSTLLNKILNREVQTTREIRNSDQEGKHTTSHRELFKLPSGALIIDTPGLRELQVFGDEQKLDSVFEQIQEIASSCRFHDCQHNGEPGCEIDEALESGKISIESWSNFLKMKREIAHINRKMDARESSNSKKKMEANQ